MVHKNYHYHGISVVNTPIKRDNIPDYFDKFEDIPVALSTNCHKLNHDYDHQKQCVNRFFDLIQSKKPMNMFLHDYKGGYLNEDCGTSIYYDPSKDVHPFIFHLMPHSDVFVYFSHKTISVPPLRWIEESHNHSKVVLGTILFENETSEHTSLFASDAMSNEKLHLYVQRLVELMGTKCFDGYLINVEVELTLPEISNLLKFIDFLKSTILTVRRFKPIIVWYDAVTVKGDLAWQNAVTAKNKIFFDKCGFILLNYSWKDEQLQKTSQIVDYSDKNRVFVGVDAFGRNTIYGSGSAGCADAFKIIKKHNFSTGVFAPAYQRECLLEPQDSGNASAYDYWKPVNPYLHYRPFIFAGTFSIGRYFKKYQGVERSLRLDYVRNHVFPLCPSGGFKVNDNGIQFTEAGQYLLQTVEFTVSSKCYLTLKDFNGELEFRNIEGYSRFTKGMKVHILRFPAGIIKIFFFATANDFLEGFEITRCDILDLHSIVPHVDDREICIGRPLSL